MRLNLGDHVWLVERMHVVECVVVEIHDSVASVDPVYQLKEVHRGILPFGDAFKRLGELYVNKADALTQAIAEIDEDINRQQLDISVAKGQIAWDKKIKKQYLAELEELQNA